MLHTNEKQTGILIPIPGTLLLPNTETTIYMKGLEPLQLEYLENKEHVKIAVLSKHRIGMEDFDDEDFYKVGVTFSISKIEQAEQGSKLTIQIEERVRIEHVRIEEEMILAEWTLYPEEYDLTVKDQEEILGYIKEASHEITARFQGGEEYNKLIDVHKSLNGIIVYLAQYLKISNVERYELLAMQSMKERCLRFMDYLLKHKESIELSLEISEKFSEKANKHYRESVLREQLRAIQAELNEGKEGDLSEEDDYRKRIDDAAMPEDVKETALEELDKLMAQGAGGTEHSVIRNYLELLIQLPWRREKEKEINLEKAREILDSQHYGLTKIKERMIQHLAVMQLNKKRKGSILLLVGPPGTGKTSLGKSIAEALDRKYIRLSLGGIRDESEIRGHRRTYVGAMPGRIMQSLKKAGVSNPVMILDEVDKLMPGGFSGDPASALLEVLDPEQNNSFVDHYVDQPYDLSDVFFIATANSLDSIPQPLLDRMEIIHVSSYTADEKFHIAKNYLLPEVLKDHGLSENQVIISDDMIRLMISDYTMEAGVRGLKKHIASISRAASARIVSKSGELPYIIKGEDLEEILGHKVSRHEMAQTENPPGVVTGLAWTPVGGEILMIEATDMPGKGEVILTGKLGDVMKESARISLSLLKSRLPVNTIDFKEKDLHIHVPSGAVPKDGPSAGIALFTALASLVTGIKVDSRLAMTGEITLRGAVLPIGGLKEKLLGAQRAGIKKVLIPKDNESDLRDVPEEVRKELNIVTVETVEDVLNETLKISMPRIEHIISFLPGEDARLLIK
ncbi:MAG: endopeptidase La [Lachnospiraceae bacterium]